MSRERSPILWDTFAVELGDTLDAKRTASFVLDVLQHAIRTDALVRDEIAALLSDRGEFDKAAKK